MGNAIGKVVLLLTFAGTAYRDYKEKEIPLWMPALAAIVGMILHLLCWETTLADILLGTLVGVLLLFVAWISRERVGIGDGIMLMVSGIFLGFRGNLTLLFMALGMVGLVALFFIVVKRKGKDYRLPFVPFLLAAYLVYLI